MNHRISSLGLFLTKIHATGILVIIFIFVGCKSSPHIIEYYVSDDVMQYYFPYTTWKTNKTNNIRVRLDITHRTEIGWDIVCNISFINRRVIPQYVSTIAFYADEVFYQLKDVKLFLLDREINAYRITSNISFKDFLSICRSDSIVLIATIDNEDYHFDAPDEFYIYSDQYIKLSGGDPESMMSSQTKP